MSDIHAVPQTKPIRPGQCGWSFRWEGELLRCEENADAPSWFCRDHWRVIESEGDPE